MKEVDNLIKAAEDISKAWSKFIDAFDYYSGVGDMAEDIEFKEMARLRLAVKLYKESLEQLK